MDCPHISVECMEGVRRDQPKMNIVWEQEGVRPAEEIEKEKAKKKNVIQK